MFNSILEVQPRMTSSDGGKTADEIVEELAESILTKLSCFKLDMDKADAKIFQVDDKGR